jgi:transposase
VDEAGKIVWRGMADTHPDAVAARLKGFQGKARQGWHREWGLYAASAPLACCFGLSNGVHGRPPGRGRDQQPADQERQGRCLGLGGDAAHGGWFTEVHVKSAESHKIKTLLGARMG